uniref:Uncharacterized protein n=1 Tax=Glossina palpalis gambiensis TaxID=67801 RepID=A0A1B0BDL3_9MUSC
MEAADVVSVRRLANAAQVERFVLCARDVSRRLHAQGADDVLAVPLSLFGIVFALDSLSCDFTSLEAGLSFFFTFKAVDVTAPQHHTIKSIATKVKMRCDKQSNF